MAKALFKVFFAIIKTIVNVITAPIWATLKTFAPDFSNALSTFSKVLSYYTSNLFSWFFQILPPNFRSLLIAYFTYLISVLLITYTIHGLIKLFEIIKKIKIW